MGDRVSDIDLRALQVKLQLQLWRLEASLATEAPPSRVAGGARSPDLPVGCPVGCRGTLGCLCGQGELSDNRLWIEND